MSVLTGKAFAPSNIALVKYWGKRDEALRLPMNSSLSISLGDKGATAEISVIEDYVDRYIVNGNALAVESPHYTRLKNYVDRYLPAGLHVEVRLEFNIPFAAGLASSACCFASIILALNALFSWGLSTKELSIRARLGSGSACRSIEQGFIEWAMGEQQDGLDSYGVRLETIWPELCVGLCILQKEPKKVSSSIGMQRTVDTSKLYSAWPSLANNDIKALKAAIIQKNFCKLGQISEQNALSMHATMLASWPPLSYMTPDTLLLMQRVWRLRFDEKIPIYFTQDAGPNLKLLFESTEKDVITHEFPDLDIVYPFGKLDER